ncbi:MAG: aldehyde dehydrogenase family protein [Burkholderiales bacterium]|nr:aldehyde dehydrogenase family protein [Burkholderiales bacterium]
MDAHDVRRAIEAANAAFPGWRAKPRRSARQSFRRWYDLVMAAQDDLALLLTTEQGKPLAEARGEIAYGASFHRAGTPRKESASATATSFRSAEPDKRLLVLEQPVGVCAAITPSRMSRTR